MCNYRSSTNTDLLYLEITVYC